MSNPQKILLSGVKPTGRPHIGNYFGALKQFVDLQDEYESFIMIADYHALTSTADATVLRQDILDVAIDYLAIGLDPEKVVIFQQSAVPEHTELAWIFNCLTTMPYLARAHAYKDALAKNKEVNVGVFTYPLLMAADILLYDADVVPVGLDQKQHVEIARDTAEKFNRAFGEIFKLPEALVFDQVKTVIGLDGQKMSKSYRNTIPLFADERELKQLVMSIVTDSKGEKEPKNPEECNVFALHRFFSAKDLSDLKRRYVNGEIGYRESKEILFNNMNEYLAPLREKRRGIATDPGRVVEILRHGSEKARARASAKMETVRRAVGVSLR
ncbi:MAG: tryptophan--tRNA ligase [Candidatus Vogelbacteria bacterium]|nr:tryptophan--tRNA ligase [Candidatus Vogelbacteria bacterium]